MKPEATQAYPLHWPEGWPRTPAHVRQSGNQFKGGSGFDRKMVSFDRARRLLQAELGRLKAKNVVISTDVPLRLDGQPYAGALNRKMDPGVAVYFTLRGKQMSMAQDAFATLEANTRSLGLAIEALRSLERHGGGKMMERAFDGFAALPAPEGSKPKRPWWVVLNYGEDEEARADLSVDEVEARYRTLAKRRHPDADGGSHEAMTELNDARAEAVRELGGEP